ncbi:Cut-like homeobox [Datura stramonium]|uniref:Cut-like homeobox n=1 Tax=Datura stramonium TaxID=4076 RepID=A0ABS8RST9_DATST|nr:Cut-like homeobox [Datura stramonium]
MDSPRGGPERDKANTTSSSTPLAAVASFWKDFDLEKERSTLDEQGLRIAENQENSQKNRRKLAESTRGARCIFPSAAGYQEEVDNLTKRAKYGENAFLNIYQKLYEAPDPYPVIASIAEKDSKLSELESENRKMKLEQQMEEKVKEIVEIKQRSLAEENQKTLEQIITKSLKHLLRSIHTEAGFPSFSAAELIAAIASPPPEVDITLHCGVDDGAITAGSITPSSKKVFPTMQKLHELAQSQLFEVRAQSGDILIWIYTVRKKAAKQSEFNLLMDEVERAQGRLLSLEREKGLLRSQLQTANEDNDHKNSDNLDADSALENSLYAKRERQSLN